MDPIKRMLEERQAHGLRVDYVKFKYRAEYDVSQVWGHEFVRACEQLQRATGASGGWKAHRLSPHTDPKPLWSLEAWGAVAEAVNLLNFEFWTAHLERMDVRQSVDMDSRGREALYQHLRSTGTGNRSLTQYSSRKRQKVGGRHAGGEGFAVGSHKSDFRASFYQRGGEPGAVEFQMSGTRIARALDVVNPLVEQQPNMPDWRRWSALFTALHGQGWGEATRVMGLSRSDTLGILSGDALPPQNNAEIVARIDALVAQLPAEERVGLVQALQLSVFGV